MSTSRVVDKMVRSHISDSPVVASADREGDWIHVNHFYAWLREYHLANDPDNYSATQMIRDLYGAVGSEVCEPCYFWQGPNDPDDSHEGIYHEAY